MPTKKISLLADTVSIDLEHLGTGQTVLLLHGGAGPASMRPLLGALRSYELILPTHPGFEGTARAAWVTSIPDLATCYLALLDALKLTEVIVVGNSIGGWIAAEMASRRPSSLSGVALLNAVGLEPSAASGPIVDTTSLSLPEMVALSFADPSKLQAPDPSVLKFRQANQAVLMAYAGTPYMHDPQLSRRLADVKVPTLVLWGDHDRIVTPQYGREFARQIPGAQFELVEGAGHLPQLEAPDKTADAIKKHFQASAR